MKKFYFLCFSLLLATLTFGQETTETDETKRFRHEFGVDVSSILGGVLIETAFGFTTVEPYKFPLNYRLYTPVVNLRAAVGVSSADEVYSVLYTDGLDTLEGNDLVLNTRIGVEKMHQITSLWSFYYGIDYEYSRFNDFRQSKSVSQGYQTDWTIGGYRHGIAPILGFRITFNDRIGLQTELKCIYNIHRRTYERDYTPIVDNPNNLPDDEFTYTLTNSIDFEIPNFLILTVRL